MKLDEGTLKDRAKLSASNLGERMSIRFSQNKVSRLYPVHSALVSREDAMGLGKAQTNVLYVDLFSVVAQHGGVTKVCLVIACVRLLGGAALS